MPISLFQCLTIACLGLHYKSMVETQPETRLLLAGTFVGFTIIQLASILGEFSIDSIRKLTLTIPILTFAAQALGTPINKRVDILFAIIGSVMFIASGALAIKHYNDIAFIITEADKLGLTKGILALVNGVLFLVSSTFTFRD